MGALMCCSFEEMVETLMEAAAVGERNCHGIAKNVMFGQLAPMGTGAFDVTLDIDMLKGTIVDRCLLVQNIPVVHTDGGITPGQVAMTLHSKVS
jgi:DNA-directed RNA polymerase II subunit RPB1